MILGVYTHPLDGLQPSVVQSLSSLQSRFAPGRHAPVPLQRSPTVQASPSSHVVLPDVGGWRHWA